MPWHKDSNPGMLAVFTARGMRPLSRRDVGSMPHLLLLPEFARPKKNRSPSANDPPNQRRFRIVFDLAVGAFKRVEGLFVALVKFGVPQDDGDVIGRGFQFGLSGW
jgi:hypothetical protein